MRYRAPDHTLTVARAIRGAENILKKIKKESINMGYAIGV